MEDGKRWEKSDKRFYPFEALNIGPVPDRIGFLFKVFHLLTSKDEMGKCGENTSHGKAGNIIQITSWMETYFLNFSSPGDYLLKLLIKLDLVWRLWQKLPPASKLLLTAKKRSFDQILKSKNHQNWTGKAANKQEKLKHLKTNFICLPFRDR